MAYRTLPEIPPKIQSRFWAKVTKGDPSECWEWNRGCDADGYGVFHFKYATYRAHRMAWTLTHGELSPALAICHRCDNPPCCNPAHMFPGTLNDNNVDKAQKGRSLIGAENPRARITDAQVLEIRRLSAMGVRRRALSERFSISVAQTRRIVVGEQWAHLSSQ